MKMTKTAPWIFLTILIAFLWGCGGGSGGSAGFSTGSGDTGTLSLSLVDAPGGEYQAVYVTIKEVQVCHATFPCDPEDSDSDCGCQWETVATLNQTFNLLELVNGVMAALGQKDLDAGTYNQMRLLLHDVPDDSLNLLGLPHPFPQYLIDMDDQEHAMKVPSGYQTGIKLVHPFEIEPNRTTELILDFDVAKSVVKAGNSGKYLLKPTIKVIGTYFREVVSGTVSNSEGDPLAGARVVAWHQDQDGHWSTVMSTFTDDTGGYTLYLDSGAADEPMSTDYKIVAIADEYEPECRIVSVEADQTYPDIDFVLEPATVVSVTGTITGVDLSDGEEPDPVVQVNFSRDLACDPGEPVEVASIPVGPDDNSEYMFSIQLPAAAYTVTASTPGLETLSQDLDASEPDPNDPTYVLEFSFQE